MSKKKNRKSSNQILKHKTEGFGHKVRSTVRKIKSSDLLKRKVSYFSPYTWASTKTDKFDRRRFSPFGPEVQRVQTVRSDGYLTTGTFLDKIRFNNPLNELPCQKRRVRRRVIFALNLTKKGSGAKKHRFTLESKISCKG